LRKSFPRRYALSRFFIKMHRMELVQPTQSIISPKFRDLPGVPEQNADFGENAPEGMLSAESFVIIFGKHPENRTCFPALLSWFL